MKQTSLLKILLALLLIAVAWLWFNPQVKTVYESDKRVLEENARKAVQIQELQKERDSLRSARSIIKEKIVYRYIKFKEDEKAIPTMDMLQLDSVIRSGF